MTPEKEVDPPEYVVDELLMAARKTTQRYSVDDCIAMAEALGLLRGLEDLLRKSGPKRKRRARKLAARLDKHLKKTPPPLLKED